MSSDDAGRTLVEGLRAHVLVDCGREAARYRRVWAITTEVHARAGGMVGFASRRCVARGGSLTEHDLDAMAARDVAAATGWSSYRAEQEVQAARMLCSLLTATLAALAAGRLDPARARTLADAVVGLTDAQARKVETVVLEQLPSAGVDSTGRVGPWDGCSPKAFTAKVKRAVAKVSKDTEDEARKDVRDLTDTWVRIHPENPALATMTITGPTELVVGIAATLDGVAAAMSVEELAGRTRGMAKVDLIADAITGQGGRPFTGGVRRELGVVLNADTLFGEGPAAHDPGEVRGAGEPVPASAATARVLAEQAQANGAPTCVLLADRDGMLIRLLRVGTAPETGWTPATLAAATKAALVKAPYPKHETSSYQPTVEIADTVRARDPVCTFPGCGVPASRADLDHTVPHPHGPTSVQNLSPRSRRCHRYKTAGLWHARTRTNTTGQVVAHEWTSPLGTRQVVEVVPLPGYATGEAYAAGS